MTDMIERVARAIAPKAWSASEDSTPQKYRRKASLAHARAAITAMRETEETAWRPIETIPMGQRVLLAYANGEFTIGNRMEPPSLGLVATDGGFEPLADFSHWRPLPAPPVALREPGEQKEA